MNKKESNFIFNTESSLETIFALYLLNIGQYVSEYLFHHYLSFTKQFRSCYYEHGQDVFENCFKGEGDNKITKFSTDTACFAPLIADFFIRYYVPQ